MPARPFHPRHRLHATAVITALMTGLLALAATFLSALPAPAQQPRAPRQAQPAPPAGPANITVTGAPRTLDLSVGKSLVVASDRDIRRVSLASPEAAAVVLLSPRQLYVTGKAPGSTSLTLWGADEAIMSVFDVDVSPDAGQLRRLMAQALPGERSLRAVVSGKNVLLSGQVSSTPALATALAIAEGVAPGKVQNALSVGGVQQVMLEVRVAEMNRSVLERFGINFSLLSGGHAIYSMIGGLTKYGTDGLSVTDNVGAVVSPNLGGGSSLTTFIDALKNDGLVKVLAEPNLICLSGKSANFLAGGEIPIPIPQALGTVAIEFKPFGVGLNFTPTVLDGGRISMLVNPEVSELDFDLGVTINSWKIPGLTTRRATTTVELASGQSFAIAGLIKDSTRESIKKFPGLGDVPILGALFRSSEFRKSETELVIIVTPHLVKPLDMARQTLPTDGFREPNAYEFFINGDLEGPAPTTTPMAAPSSHAEAQPVPSRSSGAPFPGGFDGRFGQGLPPEE